jgi:hypothetical protein
VHLRTQATGFTTLTPRLLRRYRCAVCRIESPEGVIRAHSRRRKPPERMVKKMQTLKGRQNINHTSPVEDGLIRKNNLYKVIGFLWQ